MKRKILTITGSRADYGLMTPVYKKIKDNPNFKLEMIVLGMHFLPEFKSSLKQIKRDKLGKINLLKIKFLDDEEVGMSKFVASTISYVTTIIKKIKPNILLLQGDRGEMLAGAIAAAFMNIPIVHMSGGDYSGSIDDSLRNAISKFAHIHLTTCKKSTERLLKLGESSNRIFEVGEPGVDLIKSIRFTSKKHLAREFRLDPSKPIILATQHPVTTEYEQAGWQIKQTLSALEDINIQTIFTYPNNDAGGKMMIDVLESFRNRNFIRIIPNLGSQKYLSIMKISSVLVGNSSSGILEAPSFKIPVINIGTRQYGRVQANNIINVNYNKKAIKNAIRFVLTNKRFKDLLKRCKNPYGEGNTAKRTVKILERLIISSSLITKWIDYKGSFLSKKNGI